MEGGVLRRELRLFARLSAPAVLSSLCDRLTWTYTSTYLGTRFGTNALSGFSLAVLSGNLTGQSVIIGMLSACETLQPQAFAQKRFPEVGLIAIRAYVACLFLLAPLVPLWLNIDSVLVFFDQPEESSVLARRFLATYCLAFPGVIFFESAVRFYRAQNVVMPFVAAQLVAFALHPLWVSFFVDTLNLGFDGAAIAHVVSVYTICLLVTVTFLHGPDFHHPDTMPRTNVRGFLSQVVDCDKITALLRLGIPGVLSMSEWWFWEVVCFFSGHFGTPSLAAHSIAYAVVPLSYMIPQGFAIGMTTRLGAHLAAGDVSTAKQLARWGSGLCVVSVFGNAVFVYIARHWIWTQFSTDPEVLALCDQIWLLVTLFLCLDGLLGVHTGIMRALSLQSKMGIAVVLSLWMLGVPIIWFVASHLGLALYGIWIAMPIVYLIMDLFLFLSYAWFDWEAYSLSLSHQPIRSLKSKNSSMESENDRSDDEECMPEDPMAAEVVEMIPRAAEFVASGHATHRAGPSVTIDSATGPHVALA